jgi:glycosyltransferase involved in cell wall biosynthesis
MTRTSSTPFRVLMTCSVFEPGFRGGGLVRSLAFLIDSIPEHIDVTLVTSDRDLQAKEPYPGLSGKWLRRSGTQMFYLNVRRWRAWLTLWRTLRATSFDAIYVNSLWSPFFTVVPVLARRLGLLRAVGVVIAPRGELSPGALSVKAWKKRLFSPVWGRLLKSTQVTWHASTTREASEIRAAYPWARIHVSLDQVSLPREPLAPIVEQQRSRLVYVSRIVSNKNLLLAIEALSKLFIRADLDVYGPVEDASYWRRCLKLADDTGTADRVRYRGELAPSDVCRTFQQYDAFVFPTLGENFGHVIAESLSASCPVICSDQTPWTAVLDAGGGAAIRDLTVDNLSSAINRVAAGPPEERMKRRQAAGDAYRAWHAGANNENFLEVLSR